MEQKRRMDGREDRRNRQERPENKQPGSKKKLWIILLAVAAAVVCVIAVSAARMSAPAPQPQLITTESASVMTPASSASPSASGMQMLPAMQELYAQNSDLAGWITIEGTEGDYPVMYTPQDGEFYLYRNFEKEEDPTLEGCIFIDKNCTIDPRSTNLLLHGHNMKNGTMFHTLISYEEEAFYKEHLVIKYNTLYEEEEYEIAAVFLSKIYKKSETDVFKFYQFYNAQTQEEFDSFIQNCKELELYETGITPEYGDELLTLSTCEYSQENGRIVVVARKIKDGETAAPTQTAG